MLRAQPPNDWSEYRGRPNRVKARKQFLDAHRIGVKSSFLRLSWL